eukprot:5390615-Prymnesium_polylepis.1
MQFGNHLRHAGQTTRHRLKHVVFVAIVDPENGICGPQQQAVHSAVPAREVVEEALHRVLLRTGVKEEARPRVHLRLHEGVARPRNARHVENRSFVADRSSTGGAPIGDETHPRGVVDAYRLRCEEELLVVRDQFTEGSRPGAGGRHLPAVFSASTLVAESDRNPEFEAHPSFEKR